LIEPKDHISVFGSGDIEQARQYVGVAKSQMWILSHQLKLGGLIQGTRQVWLNDDVFIECQMAGRVQRCFVWVRPEEEKAAEKAGGYPVYYYVRIQDSWVSGAPVDRFIIWRTRNMDSDGNTVPRRGMDDGTGRVLYDVDLGIEGGEIVYTNIDSEGGGDGSIAENTAVIRLMKSYKKQIEGESFNPENHFD